MSVSANLSPGLVVCPPGFYPLTLVDKVGEGAFGEVWRAINSTSLEFAVKFLKVERLRERFGSHAARDSAVRFRRESEKARHLQHHNVVQAWASGHHARRPFVVYSFYRGGSLAARLKDPGLSKLSDKLALFTGILAGVEYLHRLRIFHRDLKSDNIFMDGSNAVVGDLGIASWGDFATVAGARLTDCLAGLGTPDFWAPEQAQTPPRADEKSDVYALGLLLATLLTEVQVTNRHLASWRSLRHELCAEYAGCRCPGLGTVVEICTHAQPGDRYSSVATLREALQQYERFLNLFIEYWNQGKTLQSMDGYTERLDDFTKRKCRTCGAGPLIIIQEGDLAVRRECVSCRMNNHQARHL